MAGGVFPLSKEVERSQDYGKTFSALPEMPYGPSGIGTDAGVYGACLTIVDTNTVFIAGGRYNQQGKQNQMHPSFRVHSFVQSSLSSEHFYYISTPGME